MRSLCCFVLGFALSVAAVAEEPLDELAEGKAIAERVCAACHGLDGAAIDPSYPKIGGQYADYLYQALLSYKTGGRENAIMYGFAATLSKADMRAVAAYYASQDAGLTDLSIN